MIGSNPLSKDAFESLIQHLKEVEANKSKIIDEFSGDSPEELREFEYFVMSYIKRIENFVDEIKNDEKDNFSPLVIIGSEVDVKDLDNDKHFMFRIVSPFKSQRESKRTFDVSCLSPVGQALLLKKLGDTVEVEAPGGIFQYKIESIKYP